MAARTESTALVPAGAFALAGASTVVASVSLTRRSVGGFEGTGGQFVEIILAVTAVTSFLTPFVIWTILAGAVYLLTMFFAGEGSFRKTFRTTGYALLPYVAGTIVIAAVQYRVLQTVPPVGSPEEVQQFVSAYQEHPTLQTAQVVNGAFLLWSGVLLTFGIEHARAVSRREAAIAAGLPTGLWLLWQLSGVLGSLLLG